MLAKEPMTPRATKIVEAICTTSRDLIPASDTRLLPLLAGGQATVFHRILPLVESWKALGFHSPYYTKYGDVSQRIGLYFKAFREILQKYARGVIHTMAPLLFCRIPLFTRPFPSAARGSHTPNPTERRRENLFDAAACRRYNGIAIELRVFECNSCIGSRLVIDRRLPYFRFSATKERGIEGLCEKEPFQHKPANQISKTALSRSSQRIREIPGKSGFFIFAVQKSRFIPCAIVPIMV